MKPHHMVNWFYGNSAGVVEKDGLEALDLWQKPLLRASQDVPGPHAR